MRDLTEPGALPLPPEGGGGARRAGVGEGVSTHRSRRKPGTTTRARSRFTRQFPIGPFFANFACREKWLVVEIDGSQHADNPRDRARDEFMRGQGYSVLRFWNTDVLKHRGSVCETILATLEGRLTESTVTFDLRYVHAVAQHQPSAHTSDHHL
jgi:hypothetical protein